MSFKVLPPEKTRELKPRIVVFGVGGAGGNAVNHEDEMMRVASNQMDFDAVANLYSRSLALIKLAAGGG